VSLKIPAKSATVLVSSDLQVRGLEMLCAYVKAELNLRHLHVQTADRNDTKLECTPDARLLGKRLGAKYKAVAAAIKTLPSLSGVCRHVFWGRVHVPRACMFHVHVVRACILHVRPPTPHLARALSWEWVMCMGAC